MPSRFPSPCGVWVVSAMSALHTPFAAGFRPLAGCGLFQLLVQIICENQSFRPLAGCGLFPNYTCKIVESNGFPSPCGVWVVSQRSRGLSLSSTSFRPLAGCGLFREWGCCKWIIRRFPSPCGVWVVSKRRDGKMTKTTFPSPCGVWVVSSLYRNDINKYKVSVPLRGVGCFAATSYPDRCDRFPSPCGVWVVSKNRRSGTAWRSFPSPCGVWVVSIITERLSQ